MSFVTGQNVQANDLNNFSVATVTTSGDVTVGDDLAVAGDSTVGGDLAVTGTLTVGGQPVAINRASCLGRLTLTSNTPVTTTDVTGATTIYFTPFNGNELGVHNGTSWVAYEFSQMSIAVPATTVTMYDLFFDYNDGSPVLAALAWTNDTTRATALTTEDGILVKTGDTQQRYLGSFRTTGVSGQTCDTARQRFLWNYYNRQPRMLRVVDTTTSWTYTTATWRQARASATNQVETVIGVAEAPISLYVTADVSNDTGALSAAVAIGQGSTSVPISTLIGGEANIVNISARMRVMGNVSVVPAVGFQYWAWLEYSQVLGNTTFYGDGVILTDNFGILGELEG